ncbi:uncharacterized protein LOC144439320 [Glandiceps talaboti]
MPIGSPPLRFSYIPLDDCGMTLYVPIPDLDLDVKQLNQSTIECTDVSNREYMIDIKTTYFVPQSNWPNLTIVNREEWGIVTKMLALAEFDGLPIGVSRMECLYRTPQITGPPLEGKLTYNLYLSACRYGFYGGSCNQSCNCNNEASCHSFNGACLCAPGWRGESCEEVWELRFGTF